MDTKIQELTVHPHPGLSFNGGYKFSNWSSNRNSRPAVYVEPTSYADVQAVIRHKEQFPAPLHLISSILAVTRTLINEGGTLCCTQNLDAILGLETDNHGRNLVRVQAGCSLKKLHLWLQQQGWEIPFQAEIGETTVGSIVARDRKEISPNESSYFFNHVVAVLYINENGGLRILSDKQDGAKFTEFQRSSALSGIVVECVIEVRHTGLRRSASTLNGSNSSRNPTRQLFDMMK